MAHVGGIVLYTFSIRQFEHAIAMGSSVTREQQDSIVRIWRYAGYLLGVPETILFTNQQEARRIYHIGHVCEPPPADDAIGVANAVFKAIPAMAGLTEEAEIRSLQKGALAISFVLPENPEVAWFLVILATTAFLPRSLVGTCAIAAVLVFVLALDRGIRGLGPHSAHPCQREHANHRNDIRGRLLDPHRHDDLVEYG